MNKKLIFPAVLIIVLCVAFYLYGKYHVAPGIDFNKLELADLNGQPVSMQSFKGKKITLSFGASWCVNCIEELDDLKAIKEQELGDVEVIVISDESLEKIISFKERKGYPFTFLKMNKTFSSIGIHSIPTSYIINTNMQVMKETVGYINWRDHSTSQHLKKLME